MKKTTIFICLAALGLSKLFAFDLVPTKDLLASYLEKDTEIKNLALELQKTRLNQASTSIDNGFSITLSTGDMVFKMGDNSSFSVKPSVKATIPQLNNLGLNVSGDLGVQNGNTSFDGASLSLSADIITSAKANRDIKLLQSERSLLEAERKLASAAINTEKSFYKSLSSLLSSISSLVSKQNSLIEDKNSFERTKLQGYSSTSASYIRAELKVQTSQRDIESAIHSLIYDYQVFYLNCGHQIEIPEDIDFTLLIPKDIPAVEPVDINVYKPEQYSQIESALWSQSVNQMSRDATKKFTLTANGGYSYRNTNGNASNTVNAGVNASYQGLGVNAGVSVPINSGTSSASASQSSSPTVTLGLSYSPNTLKKNNISDQLTQISIEQEKMKIDSAYSAYESAVRQQELKLKDLQWTKQTNDTNYKMYVQVEEQMKDYYNRGLISEQDYTSAKINTLQAEVKNLINQIDMIVYNDDIKTMFVE